MIINDLKRADYLMVGGEAIDIERGVTVQLDGAREVIVCRLNSGATTVQFRKGSQQTSALHLEADVFDALIAAAKQLKQPEVPEITAGRSYAIEYPPISFGAR